MPFVSLDNHALADTSTNSRTCGRRELRPMLRKGGERWQKQEVQP